MKKLTLLVLFTGTAFASSGWIRVESSGFEIWTDAGETKAKEALHSLQQIREIMLAIQPAGAPPSRTLRLLLFHSDSEFARFRPLGNPQAAGLYLAGRQYDYIVVMNGGVPGNRSVLYHEYLHLFSRDRKLPVPHWFDEGMAELFSNVSSTRSEIQVGAPIEAHVRRLLAEPNTDLQTLFTPASDPLFYAKSWALVRLLTIDAAYRAHLDRFLAAVAHGDSHANAFKKTYGKSLTEVAADLRRSLTGNSIRPWVLKTAIPATYESAEAAEQSHFATELVFADLLENLQRFDEARHILLELARENNRDPNVESQLGDISLRQGNAEEAFQHYSRAIQSGSADPRIYFERAMIRREDVSAKPQVIEDLRKAVELKPDYAEAFQQLNALVLRDQTVPPHKSSTGAWKNRQGDRHAEGALVEVDCSRTPARFVLNTQQGELDLLVSDPSQVVIGNDPGVSAELNCGRMPPRVVSVDYLEASKEITAIQFK